MQKKFIFLAIFLGALGGIVFEGSALDFLTLGGERIGKEELLSSEKTILFFWVTWCPYCRREIKNIGRRCEELEKEGFEVYLVNVGQEKNLVRQFIEKENIKCTVLLDRYRSLAYEYNIRGYPTYIFLNKDKILGEAHIFSPQELEGLYKQVKSKGEINEKKVK